MNPVYAFCPRFSLLDINSLPPGLVSGVRHFLCDNLLSNSDDIQSTF